MKGGYIRSLDGLRAVAILLVMAYHFDLNNFGWMGVQLFFVLSGFLITGILWKEKFRPAPLGSRFKKFWTRRALRIFPLYYGYLFVLGLTFITIHFPNYYLTYIPYLATYTTNFGRLLPNWHVTALFTHLWSLSVEEQFYLLFPLFIFLSPPKLVRAVLCLIICLGPLIRLGLGIYYRARVQSDIVAGDALYWNTLSQLDAFCIGGLIPVFSLDKKLTRPSAWMLFFFSVAFIAGVLNALSTGGGHFLHNYANTLGYGQAEMQNDQHIWSYTLLNFFFASFILVLVSDHGRNYFRWMRGLLEKEWMVKIGKVSYGMYIYHFSVLVYLFDKYLPRHGAVTKTVYFIAYVVIVFVISQISFRFYESWFLRWKDRLYAPRKGDLHEPVGAEA
jgi:peptidoglycan/LPS O-acetylase OafA/YrhL